MPKSKPDTSVRVMCIDDYPAYAEMVGLMLAKHGGFTVGTAIVPLDFDALRAFNPDVIVINMVRKLESVGHGPMRNFYAEVEGAKAFRALQAVDFGAPIVATAIAVQEVEIPEELKYHAYLEIPQKLEHLAQVITQVARTFRPAAG